MKIYGGRHKKALSLKKRLDDITCKIEKHIDDFELKEKSLKPSQRQRANSAFDKMQNKLHQKENEAYKAYYDHMNEDFGMRAMENSFLNKNYKNGFTDEKYIHDMYKQKAKEQKHGKK